MAVSALGSVFCNWLLWLVALIFVLLRLWVRWYFENRLSLSDAFVVLATLLMTFSLVSDSLMEIWLIWKPLVSLTSSSAANSRGRLTTGSVTDWIGVEQQEEMRRKEIVFRLLFFSAPAYVSVMWSIKCSFILLYYSIFPLAMKKLRIALHSTAVLVASSWIVILLMNFLWCRPLSRNWDQGNSKGICFSYSAPIPFYLTCALHLLTDCLIYILPLFILPALSLTKRENILLCAIFGLGLVSILSAAGRIAAVKLSEDLSVASVLSAIEMATSVIVACCLPLKWLSHSYKNSTLGASGELDSGRGDEFGTIHFQSRVGTRNETSVEEKVDTGATSPEKVADPNIDLERLGGIDIEEEPRMPRESGRVGSGTTRSEDQDSVTYAMSGQISNEQLSGLTSPYRPRAPEPVNDDSR